MRQYRLPAKVDMKADNMIISQTAFEEVIRSLTKVKIAFPNYRNETLVTNVASS